MQKFVADVTGYYSAVALPTSVYFTHFTPGQRRLKNENNGGTEWQGIQQLLQKVDRTIHWINHYPVDKDNGFGDTGLLNGDISGG